MRFLRVFAVIALAACFVGCSATQTVDATHRIIRKGYKAARKGAVKGIEVTEKAVRANRGRLTPSEVEDLANARRALIKADIAVVAADKAVTQAWPAIMKALSPK